VAEGGGLLNRYTLQRRIEGSNPSVSARFPVANHRIRRTEINPLNTPKVRRRGCRPPDRMAEKLQPQKIKPQVDGRLSSKPLKLIADLLRWSARKSGFWCAQNCVFFTQHSPEKRPQDLWERSLFIA